MSAGVKRSLRARLFVLLLVLGGVAALGVGGATYLSVRAQVDLLFDYHLQQMALALRGQEGMPDDERQALAHPELDYVVQWWSKAGGVLRVTRPADVLGGLPSRAAAPGYSVQDVQGAPWRVYAALSPVGSVQIAQPVSVRLGIAREAAWRSVLPLAASFPLAAVALWWLLGASLRPIQRVADALAGQRAEAPALLPAAGLPAEIEPLVLSFNGLLARLGQVLEMQRGFVADAAHELRTPLTALKLQLGLLETASDDTQRQAAIERLRAGVARAARLVEQLLALARSEPGAPAVAQKVDLAALARLAAADIAPLAARQGAVLALQVPHELWLRGHPDGLRSLLVNLLDNAVKHGGPSPHVSLSLLRDGDAATLTVDDSGPGIPQEEQARVFGRFHRRAHAGVDGSGLGLAIVEAVVRQHGGHVRLGTSPHHGLRVEVVLPAVQGDGAEGAKAEADGGH